MRILFVNPYYKPYLGGIERVIEKLGQEFLNSGQVEAVGILTTHWAFPRKFMQGLSPREKMDGFEIFRISSWPKSAPPFYQVPLVWFNPLDFKEVIEQFKPDVIQLMSDRWFWGNFWAWVLKGKAQVVFSLSFHKLTWGQQVKPLLWLMKQFLRPINTFLTRQTDWVHVITEHEKKLVQQTYRTPQKKIHIIPWGVDFPVKTSPQGRGINLPVKSSREIAILCVGRLSKHKGQAWLLEVFAEIQNVITKSVKLIFVGADEGVLENLKSQISNLKIEDKVEFAGEIADTELGEYYQKADIFALFPEYEAFGLVFLEAMAHGVPVLTHKVGAIEEVLKDKAVLVEPFNQAQAKVALTKLIEDDEFRIKLGQEGKRYIEENFSWEKTAGEFLEAYLGRGVSSESAEETPRTKL